MKVAVENGLEAIRQTLEAAGHSVVPLYGFSGAVDAIVYERAQLTKLRSAVQNSSGSSGIFLICAQHMSAAEILQALETRSYGAIF